MLFQTNSAIAAAVAGGIALVVWFILFGILLFKKKKKGSNDSVNAEQQIEDNKELGENVKPSLFEMQIPESPGPVVKAKKLPFKPKSKPEPPKKSIRDFSVQANGMNNQSNQTDTIEQDEAWREEIAELRRKIDVIKQPSKIPRKHGLSNLFHDKSKGSSSSTMESIGIQSLSTSSSSIQTNNSKEISTETSKIFVNTATDPMSKKRKESFIQPEFVTASIPQPGFVNTASSPIMGSISSMQTPSQSPTPSAMSLISNDSAVSLAESESSLISNLSSAEEGNKSNISASIPFNVPSPTSVDESNKLNESTISAPPPVIVSSPTPPLIEKKKLSDDKSDIVPITTQTLETSNQSKDQDSFESSNDEEDIEEEKDFDDLDTVNVRQSKLYKDQRPKLPNSFKLCLDSVRMLPDNALTYKLSGKLINVPEKADTTFSVIPQFGWPHKSPRSEFEKVINKEGKELDKSAILFLKVYTIDRTTKKTAYLGYNIFSLVDQKTGLPRGGGHKLSVYSGIPKPEKGNIKNLKEKHVDPSKLIPCLTICIRVIGKDNNFLPRPLHRKGYYNHLHKPTKLETKLFKHYFSITKYEKPLKKICEENKWLDFSESSDWLKTKYQDYSKSDNFTFRLFSKNDTKKGIKVKVLSGAGFPFVFEGFYLQCLVEFFGKKTKFITQKLEMISHQKNPKWNDEPFHIKPGQTKQTSALLIKVFGVFCQSNLAVDKKTGKMSLEKGKVIKLSADKPLGWAVCPVFTDDCVDAAHHVVPLFSGSPPDAFLKLLETRGASPVLIKFALSKSIIKSFKTPAVLKISVYDALYEESELFPEMTQDDERLLKAAGLVDKYHDIVEDGPKVSQLMANAFQDQNMPAPTNSQLKNAYESLESLLNPQFSKILKQ